MRRLSRTTILLVALVAVAVVVPGAFLFAARATTLPARPIDRIPPLPEVAATARSLADDLDDLPIASPSLAAGLRAGSLFDPVLAARAFDTAWAQLTIPAGAEAAVAAFHDDIVLSGAIAHALRPDDPGWQIAAAALGPLGTDPANVGRLNDAAVALFMLGATGDVADGPPPLIGLAADAQWDPMNATSGAVRLLQAVDRYLPPDRSIRLDLGFLRSVVPDPGSPWSQTIEPVAAVLGADPADVTARVLLASLTARQADVPGAERAVALLAPLVDDPSTAALGWAATGDADLAEATIRAIEAPHQSRVAARRALDAYDRALALVADPGVYAGRASALVALDALDDAAAAQRRAIDLAPDALDLRTGLVEIEQARGDLTRMRTAADAAIGPLLDETWSPTMRPLRFPTGPNGYRIVGDRGFLGWSFGRERDHRPVAVSPQGSGVVVFDVVPPRVEPSTAHAWRTELAPYAAFDLALSALIADGDADGAASLEAGWDRHVPLGANWSRFVVAARIVRDGRMPVTLPEDVKPEDALALAQLVLRAAGRYREAAALCTAVATEWSASRAASSGAGDASGPSPSVAFACAGENEILAEMPADALAHLALADRLAEEEGPTARDPQVRLLAASAAEAAGDRAEATRLFRLAAAEPGDVTTSLGPTGRTLAIVRLGDLALTSGNPIGALEDYDLATAALELDPPVVTLYWEDANDALSGRAIEQVLRNNRAVARLQTLQATPDQPPSCTGPDREACVAAADSFADAIASDPGRGVYHLNAGWVARLLGDDATARSELAEAVARDPTLFPAWNDLGILMAESGDTDGSRGAFLAALAAQPDYALARWNLGVAESRASGQGIVAGQASLAEAVRLDPTLRTAPMAFRHDERTYRFSFDPGAPLPSGMPIGRAYSIAAVLLGAAGTAAALVQLQGTVTGEILGSISGAGHDALEGAGRRLRLGARRRRWRVRLGRWAGALPWLLTALVLVALTAIGAVQASPEAAAAAILVALLAVATAVAVHELGHLVAARTLGGRLLPARWLPGVAMSIVLAPFHVATGPFFAERTRVAPGARGAAWWIHAAGPLANAVYGLVIFAIYLVWPMPVLRLVVLMQLAAIGYTLLPIRPLDGEVIARTRPAVLLAAEIVVTGVGAAFALGLV